jgi:MYXO-CTERM domain-containing protein
MNLNRKVIAVLATSLALVAPLALKASPILGANVFASGGSVVATYISGDAANTDVLFLVGGADPIFSNHPPGQSFPGDTLGLGNFTSGHSLVFGIHNKSTGKDYFTGNGSLNPDGIAHAIVDTAFAPGFTLISFEDLFNGGDHDYNDVVFKFTNISINQHNSVPDATGTAGLMLAGLALVGAAAFKRRR